MNDLTGLEDVDPEEFWFWVKKAMRSSSRLQAGRRPPRLAQGLRQPIVGQVDADVLPRRGGESPSDGQPPVPPCIRASISSINC